VQALIKKQIMTTQQQLKDSLLQNKKNISKIKKIYKYIVINQLFL